MPFLTVLTNEQGDVIGTARTEMEGRGTGLPGRISVVARPGQRVIEIEVGDDVLSLDPSALHEFIKINHLGRAAVSDARSPSSTATNADGSRKKPSSPSEDRDLVIAPEGPRPRESVHPVGPGEAVRRNPNGTHTVVRKEHSAKRPKQPKQPHTTPKHRKTPPGARK